MKGTVYIAFVFLLGGSALCNAHDSFAYESRHHRQPVISSCVASVLDDGSAALHKRITHVDNRAPHVLWLSRTLVLCRLNGSVATNGNLSSFHTDLKSGLQFPLVAMFRTWMGGGWSTFLSGAPEQSAVSRQSFTWRKKFIYFFLRKSKSELSHWISFKLRMVFPLNLNRIEVLNLSPFALVKVCFCNVEFVLF